MASIIKYEPFQITLDHNSVFVVDVKVFEIYSDLFERLDPSKLFVVHEAESQKSWEGLHQILNFFLKNKLHKKSQVYAIGGGALLDLVGFATAIFKRGIKLVAVPTTLLAMLDASIGGKNGINFAGIKNLLGTIKDPDKIIVDINFLNSLDQEHFLSGLAEILKIGLISSAALWKKLQNQMIDFEIIKTCQELKQTVVSLDPLDQSIRHVLNFGHTLGHAYESYFKGKISHGRAVALGMLVETILSASKYNLSLEESQSIASKIRSVYAPFDYVEFNALLPFLKEDKKFTDHDIQVHILDKIGSYPRLEKILLADLKTAYEAVWM
jgi:3-dehydroquinate synthase